MTHPDPNFPRRPEHPDFDRMSDQILRLDAKITEDGADIISVMDGVIDPASVFYMSENRVARSVEIIGENPEPKGLGMASWIDGFMLGVAFAQAGGHRRKKAQ